MSDIICNCAAVTKEQIVDAARKGAKTVEEIGEVTQAGTICGVCISDIEEILKSCEVSQENCSVSQDTKAL